MGPSVAGSRLAHSSCHVSNHAKLCKAREVGGIDELQMCDLMTWTSIAVGLARGLDGIEAGPHRSIANGVDVPRKSRRVELGDQPGEPLRVEVEVAELGGWLPFDVEIGLEQCRGLCRGFHNAVGENLDDAGPVRIDIDCLAGRDD